MMDIEDRESKRPYRLTKEEREVIIGRTEIDEAWEVYTTSKPVMTRLDKWAKVKEVIRLGGEVIGKIYEVPLKSVGIHKPRKVTEAMRQRGLALSKESVSKDA